MNLVARWALWERERQAEVLEALREGRISTRSGRQDTTDQSIADVEFRLSALDALLRRDEGAGLQRLT